MKRDTRIVRSSGAPTAVRRLAVPDGPGAGGCGH
jgi:hypothetical protein